MRATGKALFNRKPMSTECSTVWLRDTPSEASATSCFDSNPWVRYLAVMFQLPTHFLDSVAANGEPGERGSINFPINTGNVALPMKDRAREWGGLGVTRRE